jgi:hypothetical protein
LSVAKLHRLAGRYDNPVPPTWFLAPIVGRDVTEFHWPEADFFIAEESITWQNQFF